MSETTQEDLSPNPQSEANSSNPVSKKAAKKATKKTAKKVAKKATKKTAKKATKAVKATKAAKKTAKKATKKVSESSSTQPNALVSAESAEQNTVPHSAPQPTAGQTTSLSAPKRANERSSQATQDKQPNSDSPAHNDAPVATQHDESYDQVTGDQRRQHQDQPQKPRSRKQTKNGRQKGGGPVKGRNRNNNQNGNGNGEDHHNSSDNRNGGRDNQNGKHKQNRNQQRNNPRQRKGKERPPKKVELTGPIVEVDGLLELSSKGFGFLRVAESGFEQGRQDVFVPPEFVRKHGLRQAVWIQGSAQEGPRGLQLTEVKTINDLTPDQTKKLPHFEELKAINPDKRISFETTSERFTTRVVDIIAPIGRGQRGLIVSPPRSGKTTLMLHMAEAVREKYDEEVHLIVLLIDERPEEVTDFKRSLPGAEIFASSNDDGAKNHCRLAELCIERAKRLTEAGKHVFILMDSITRLARAYNAQMGGNKQQKGRGIQSGGIMAGALEEPRKLFAAARNTRNAGSLTIVATALIQTNSRADEAIYQEFKGTGNMELVLDRAIAEQYLYPAVNIFKSGTRREELLLPDISMHKIHLIRRGLAGHRPEQAMERLLFFLKRFHNNAQMLLEIKG